MTSVEELAQWLETSPDLTVGAELVTIQEALLVLREEQPAKRKVWPHLYSMGAVSEEKAETTDTSSGDCRAERESAGCNQPGEEASRADDEELCKQC